MADLLFHNCWAKVAIYARLMINHSSKFIEIFSCKESRVTEVSNWAFLKSPVVYNVTPLQMFLAASCTVCVLVIRHIRLDLKSFGLNNNIHCVFPKKKKTNSCTKLTSSFPRRNFLNINLIGSTSEVEIKL